MEKVIKYFTLFLFVFTLTGSIFAVSNFFVDKYCTIQYVCLFLGLLMNLFVVSIFNRNIDKYITILVLLTSILYLVNDSTLFFLNNGLIIISLIFLFMKIINQLLMKHCFKICVFMSIVVLIEVLWGVYKCLIINQDCYIIAGSFDNPAGFATCISILFPFSLFLIRSHSRYWRIAGCSFVLIFVCAILLSKSRAGMLAFIGVIIAHLYITHLHEGIVKLSKKRVAYVVILISLGLFVGLYYLKKDSADGRLLIWRVVWEMIKDSPVIGHGWGAFKAKYMLYQAEYFRLNPDSQFSQLADNVNYPFNEYLKIWVEYGGLGLIVLLLLIIKCVSIYKRNSNPMKYPAFECIIAIAICACFSYPLKYAMTWAILGFALSIICMEHHSCSKLRIPYVRWFAAGGALFLISFLLEYTIAEMKWKKVVDRSLRGETEQMLPFYEDLREELGTNSSFLYNYAAELHVIGQYDKSMEVLAECIRYWNDYDIQLLFADCYLQKGEFQNAEECLILASNMCPNRFIPLYQLVHLYDKIGEKEKAYELANRITHKTIKVSSFKVQSIINEMQDYVDKGVQNNID